MTRASAAVFSDATIDLIFARALSCCERCGKALDRDYGRGILWSIHHREARGMGGAKYAAHLALAANGLLLCGHGTLGCHGHIERFRAEAGDLGFLVSRHGVRRADEVPLKHGLHGWVVLNNDGGWRPVTDEEIGVQVGQ